MYARTAWVCCFRDYLLGAMFKKRVGGPARIAHEVGCRSPRLKLVNACLNAPIPLGQWLIFDSFTATLVLAVYLFISASDPTTFLTTRPSQIAPQSPTKTTLNRNDDDSHSKSAILPSRIDQAVPR